MGDAIRVLHVDDDPAFTDLTARFLAREREEFAVTSETSVDGALDRLAEGGIDCVVSDYAFPGTDGLEFLDAVREEYPDLPFIFFTGRGSEEVAGDALAGGADEYLQKQGGAEQYELLANRIENAVSKRQTERRLDAARERMEFALDVTDSVVFEVDLDTNEETHHGPFQRLFGVASEDVPTSGEFYRRCVHPDDRERVERIEQPENLPGGGRTVGYEFRTNPDGGETRWIYTELYVDPGPDGEPRRLIGIDTDVTERRRRDRERKRTIDRVTDAIVRVDEDWQFTLVDDHAAELYGMDESELLGRDFWEVFSEALDTRFEEEYRNVMRTREPTAFEEYYAGLEGWFEVQVYPNDDGGISFYFRDVTDRKRRERELKRHEAILEQLPVGVFRSTPDGEFVDVNATFVSLLDAESEAEVMETNAAELYADPEVREELVDRLARDGTVRDEEVKLTTLAGEEIWVSATLTLTDAGGERYLEGITQDITERKRREQELREAEAKYRRLVEQNLVGIYLIQDGEFRFVNRRLADVFGETPEAMIGRSPYEWIAEEDHDRVRENIRRRREGEADSLRFTVSGRRADGSAIEFEVHGGRVEVDGRPAILGTLRDVTDRGGGDAG